MDKRVIIVVSVGVGVLLVLSLIIFLLSGGSSEEMLVSTTEELTEEPEVDPLVKDLLEHIDRSSNPCHDFYEFTCGYFLKTSPEPPDRERADFVTKLNEDFFASINEQLARPPRGEATGIELRVKELYDGCMDEKTLDSKGMEVLKEVLGELEGWPLIQDRAADFYVAVDLAVPLHKLAMYRSYPLFVVSFFADVDEKVVVPWFSPPVTFLTKEHYNSNDSALLVDALKGYVRGTALALKSKTDQNLDESLVQEVIDFDRKLAEIILFPAKARITSSNLPRSLSMEDLMREAQIIDYNRILKSIFGTEGHAMRMRQVINLRDGRYHIRLEEILRTVSKRTLLSYLLLRFIKDYEIGLPKSLRDISFKYHEVLDYLQEPRSRGSQCVSYIVTAMPNHIGHLIEKTFHFGHKRRFRELIERIRKSFEDLIYEVSWLNDTTQRLTFEKMTIRKSKFLRTILFVSMATSKMFLRTHSKRPDPKNWQMEISMLYFHYDPQIHLMALRLGSPSAPLLSEMAPKYIEYGSLGTIVGQLLAQAIDNTGIQFNKFGTMSKWWRDEEEAKFANLSQCFTQKYGIFVTNELESEITEDFTVGENIDVNSGLRASYMAYAKWKNESGDEPQIAELPYNEEQMFFIGFGRVHCSKEKQSYTVRHFKNYVRPPSKFSVNGAVMNMVEFSDAFKCPLGTPMNPEKKCQIW